MLDCLPKVSNYHTCQFAIPDQKAGNQDGGLLHAETNLLSSLFKYFVSRPNHIKPTNGKSSGIPVGL